ncbi:hypothetical protein Agabi119p4_6117 [Agaricus bisporus var. burnettii]|uniref:Uncharacterized protein n=1 Tax=Agaricus bisporus var. burnettii TaxID=192524 RepID=A0A8H7F188_AGABI|nr:hypothetical protein Agabi119p4_6117 [Agaricus bisporus var. burnettii]
MEPRRILELRVSINLTARGGLSEGPFKWGNQGRHCCRAFRPPEERVRSSEFRKASSGIASSPWLERPHRGLSRVRVSPAMRVPLLRKYARYRTPRLHVLPTHPPKKSFCVLSCSESTPLNLK